MVAASTATAERSFNHRGTTRTDFTVGRHGWCRDDRPGAPKPRDQADFAVGKDGLVRIVRKASKVLPSEPPLPPLPPASEADDGLALIFIIAMAIHGWVALKAMMIATDTQDLLLGALKGGTVVACLLVVDALAIVAWAVYSERKNLWRR